MSAHFGGGAARALPPGDPARRRMAGASPMSSTAVAIAVVDFLYGPFARIPTAFASRPDDQVLLAVVRPSHWSDVDG